MTGKWRELAQIRKKREQTTSCSGVNMPLIWCLIPDNWWASAHVHRVNVHVYVCTHIHHTPSLWSVFCADRQIFTCSCPFARRLMSQKDQGAASPSLPWDIQLSGVVEHVQTQPNKELEPPLLPPSCVEISPYISTKASVVHCPSVQQASSLLAHCTAPGKVTVINSTPSYAHLQQLVLRQWA